MQGAPIPFVFSAIITIYYSSNYAGSKAMSIIWELETEAEKAASEDLSVIAECAFSGNRKDQNYLEKLFSESWPSTKAKLIVEGSAWYVWWMDGVRKHMIQSKLLLGI